MNNKYNSLLIAIFFFTSFNCFAQDLIIQKNGDRVYCKIIKEDSLIITYVKPAQKAQFEIKRSEVEKYEILSSSNIEESKQPPSESILINLFGGVTSALGKFGSQDVNDLAAGLAGRGYVLNATAVIKVTRKFGFRASYLFQSHSFNHKAICDQLNVDFPNANFVSSGTNWEIKGFFVGMEFTSPLKIENRLSVSFNISAGIPKCVLPMLQITGQPYGSSVTTTQYESTTRAIAFFGGPGIKYKADKNVSFGINVNFLSAKASFTEILTKSSSGYSSYTKYDQDITAINFEAGLCFIFYHKTRKY